MQAISGQFLRERGQRKPLFWAYSFDCDRYDSPLTREWWRFFWLAWFTRPYFRLLMAIGVWEVEEGYTVDSGWWVWPPRKTFRRRLLPFGWLASIPAWFRNIFGPSPFK